MCVSTALSARCFQIEFQAILRQPWKAGMVTLVFYLRKLRLSDMKSLLKLTEPQAGRTWEYGILRSCWDLPLSRKWLSAQRCPAAIQASAPQPETL